MSIEKIAFVYPTLIKAGMVAGQIYLPDISIHLSRKNEKHLMAVTVGMMFNSVGMYSTEIDIQHGGNSVLSETTSNGRAEYPFSDSIDNGQRLYIYSLFSNSVDLDKDGIYHVIVKIFKHENDIKAADPIDQDECYFYVSHHGDGQ